jgi:hypothetical protein
MRIDKMDISRDEIREEFRQAQAQGGGTMLGGGAEAEDQDAAGGSSGAGGYGQAQNRSLHEDRSGDTTPATRELSRGERYDMEQGGGRASDAVDFERELQEDQREHQDRGQSFIDEEDAVTEGQQP